MPRSFSTYHAGVDENGLGPQLGPLLVTGVLAERLAGRPRLPLGSFRCIHDSKRLMSHHDVSVGEAWARILVPDAADPWEVLARLSLDSPTDLQTPCPAGVARQCWSHRSEGFRASPVVLQDVQDDYQRLLAAGIRILAVRCAVVCAKRLHEAQARGHSLFATDLHTMERVCLALRAHAPTDVAFVCGKVGGIHTYPSRFHHLRHRHVITECEGAARSSYQVENLGRLSFVRDADSANLLVALASLVGKYIREWCMEAITSFYRKHDPSLPNPSGYRDPVTHRFVLATATRRQAEGVPDTCFLRPKRIPTVPTSARRPS